MTTLQAIEHQIKQLSPEDLAKFKQWFAEFEADLWDQQIEQDAAAGKLDKLAQEALEEYKQKTLYQPGNK